MKFHPAAELFPLMNGIELRQLADDIRAHGLLEPIVLLDGAVLDGRNRLRACEIAGVDPRFVEWSATGGGESASPAEWVVAKNLYRRHLTTAQRAALALDLLPHLEAEAKERQRELGRTHGAPLSPETDEGVTGRSDAKAAKLVGVGHTAVAAAKAIQKRDPEIVNRMRAGELNVAQASRAAGFEAMANNNPPISDDAPAVYYGKGDKWRESSEPLRRYLAAWKKRGYSFGHIAPREARKRVETIDSLIEELTEARADLAQRSHSYRLTA